MKQTRQAVRAINQSILLRCLWLEHLHPGWYFIKAESETHWGLCLCFGSRPLSDKLKCKHTIDKLVIIWLVQKLIVYVLHYTCGTQKPSYFSCQMLPLSCMSCLLGPREVHELSFYCGSTYISSCLDSWVSPQWLGQWNSPPFSATATTLSIMTLSIMTLSISINTS